MPIKLFSMGVVLLFAAVFGLAHAAKERASVTIYNDSDWEIHHFYQSTSDDDDWGPDQLGRDYLATGESFTISGIPCDEYDVKVVDEDGDECVIEEVFMCKDRNLWHITNKELRNCE